MATDDGSDRNWIDPCKWSTNPSGNLIDDFDLKLDNGYVTLVAEDGSREYPNVGVSMSKSECLSLARWLNRAAGEMK